MTTPTPSVTAPADVASPLTRPMPITDALNQSLTAVLTQAPATPGRGTFTADASLGGWRTEVVHRFSPVWSAGAYAAGTWSGGTPEVGARVQASW